jgi:hypothetical protein
MPLSGLYCYARKVARITQSMGARHSDAWKIGEQESNVEGPGSAILMNGVSLPANREINVPGIEQRVGWRGLSLHNAVILAWSPRSGPFP